MADRAGADLMVRVAAIRQVCQESSNIDKGKVPEGCLTDRQWLAGVVLNILDGKLDDKLDDLLLGDDPCQ